MKIDDNPSPSLLFAEGTDPAAPAAGHQRLWVDTDHTLKTIDSSSTVKEYTPNAAETLPVSIIAAKGDLIVGTANDTAGILTAGTNGKVLTAASGETTGLSWATPAAETLPVSIIAAKGDLIVGTANDTAAILTAGTNDYVLTAASGEATGLKWAAAAGGGSAAFSGCKVYNNTTQTITGSGFHIFAFNSEDFDTDAFHDNSTNNGRITIPAGKAGKYAVGIFVYYTTTFVGDARFVKNSTAYSNIRQHANGTGTGWTASTIFALAEGDYVTFQTSIDSEATGVVGHASAREGQCEFWAYLIGT
jgi:hypothetical protein